MELLPAGLIARDGKLRSLTDAEWRGVEFRRRQLLAAAASRPQVDIVKRLIDGRWVFLPDTARL